MGHEYLLFFLLKKVFVNHLLVMIKTVCVCYLVSPDGKCRR